jgi:hypothetical protein
MRQQRKKGVHGTAVRKKAFAHLACGSVGADAVSVEYELPELFERAFERGAPRAAVGPQGDGVGLRVTLRKLQVVVNLQRAHQGFVYAMSEWDEGKRTV